MNPSYLVQRGALSLLVALGIAACSGSQVSLEPGQTITESMTIPSKSGSDICAPWGSDTLLINFTFAISCGATGCSSTTTFSNVEDAFDQNPDTYASLLMPVYSGAFQFSMSITPESPSHAFPAGSEAVFYYGRPGGVDGRVGAEVGLQVYEGGAVVTEQTASLSPLMLADSEVESLVVASDGPFDSVGTTFGQLMGPAPAEFRIYEVCVKPLN